MIGQIIKVISNDYTVKLDNKEKIVCKARGVFRNKNITPLAGDFCTVDINNNLIIDIKERKNFLTRPPVSNIDIAVIVMSTINPDFSMNLLDKMINIIEFNNIEPMIVITKTDLEFNDSIKDKINYFNSIGYKVFLNTEIDEIKDYLKNKTVILTGQSGAGKSTLLNKFDDSLDLKTDDISLALGRGKHTTRAITFYDIDDILIADTPGFSALSFYDMTKEDIRDNFIEFNDYRDECKYRDCMHVKEDDCKVKDLVGSKIDKDRYEDYIKFIKEKENEGISFNTK